jgi:sugar/nucleoside kinase (ribokinase family)
VNNVLWGVVCLDHYTATNNFLPGCGILHNAYHLQQLGATPRLLTRLGAGDAETITHFLAAHQIDVVTNNLLAPGRCARIEVAVDAAGGARVYGFDPGVWANYRLSPDEEQRLTAARHLHVVLTAPVIAEFMRLGAQGSFADTLVSVDFLALYDFDESSFAAALRYVDVAFVGWQGAIDDPRLQTLAQAASTTGTLAIFTLGERGLLLCEPGSAPRLEPVQAVAVTGSTNGCGDAFISYFLAEYWRSRDLTLALDRGKYGGALATTWRYALPEGAYGEALFGGTRRASYTGATPASELKGAHYPPSQDRKHTMP